MFVNVGGYANTEKKINEMAVIISSDGSNECIIFIVSVVLFHLTLKIKLFHRERFLVNKPKISRNSFTYNSDKIQQHKTSVDVAFIGIFSGQIRNITNISQFHFYNIIE